MGVMPKSINKEVLGGLVVNMVQRNVKLILSWPVLCIIIQTLQTIFLLLNVWSRHVRLLMLDRVVLIKRAGVIGVQLNLVPLVMGNKLMHIIAVATDSLVPRHKWTPWVVMNGKPLTDHQLDQHLSKLVCDAYQGSDKPPACSSATMSNKLCLKE